MQYWRRPGRDLMDVAVDLIGWLGAALLLSAYALISSGRFTAASAGFQTPNLLGAAGLTANSGYHQAWPSAALNAVWITIGLAAIARHRRRRAAGDPG